MTAYGAGLHVSEVVALRAPISTANACCSGSSKVRARTTATLFCRTGSCGATYLVALRASTRLDVSRLAGRAVHELRRIAVGLPEAVLDRLSG